MSKKWIWAAGIAVVLLILSVVVYRYWSAQSSEAAEIESAQALIAHGDYAAGYRALSAFVERHSRSRAGRAARLEAAQAWIRDYHLVGPEESDRTSRAQAELTPLITLFETESAKASGTDASTIAAHLGWAHFLSFRFAENEVGTSVEGYLRQSLRLDAQNVYGNAMLGNWLLQRRSSSLQEALACFARAVATGQERAWVRSFQLGGLMDVQDVAEKIELARAANEMRKNREPLDSEEKRRILNIYSPTVGNHEEFLKVVQAVSPEESWATFIWLDDSPDSDPEWQQVKHTFVLATIDTLAGRTREAEALYRQLEKDPQVARSTLLGPIQAALGESPPAGQRRR